MVEVIEHFSRFDKGDTERLAAANSAWYCGLLPVALDTSAGSEARDESARLWVCVCLLLEDHEYNVRAAASRAATAVMGSQEG